MRAICLLLAAAGLAFGQLDDNTITVTASRFQNAQPERAQVTIVVASSAQASLDDILSALAGTGAAAANLTYVYTNAPQVVGPINTPVRSTQWTFTLTVPFEKLGGTLSALASAQQNAAKPDSNLDISFYVQPGQLSPDSAAADTCIFPTLVGDAQRQAQMVAAAAGMRAGGIVAMSGGPAGVSPISGIGVPAARTGDFSFVSGTGGLVGFLLSAPTPVLAPTCSITVQFRLTR